MSTLKVTNIQHPNAEDPAIELSPSGGVLLSGVGDAPSGSTGAPWDLPFPVAGEAFGTQAIEDLAEATATGLSLAGNEGIGPNVVQAVTTVPFSTSATAFTPVTGLSVTITPSDADSRVLIIANVAHGYSNANGVTSWRLAGGNAGDFVGDADGSRTRGVFGVAVNNLFSPRPEWGLITSSLIYVDSPNTTSATTYSVECFVLGAGTLFVNRNAQDADGAAHTRGASSIIAIEVAS